MGSSRVVCLLPPSLASTLMALDPGIGLSMAYLHNAKLVDYWRKLQLETVITDLDYADDMAW